MRRSLQGDLVSWDLRFEIPGVPTLERARNRLHWKKESDERRHWRELIWATVRPNMRPPEPLAFAYVHVDVYRKGAVEPDRVNLLHSLKAVIDALAPTTWRRHPTTKVKIPSLGCSILVDDAPRYLDGGQYWVTWHSVKTEAEEKMVFFIEETLPHDPTWRYRGLNGEPWGLSFHQEVTQ